MLKIDKMTGLIAKCPFTIDKLKTLILRKRNQMDQAVAFDTGMCKASKPAK